jgi:hypothetical protein
MVLQLTGDQLLGVNLFAYCGNNPVNFMDSTGHFGTPLQWACAAIGAIAGWFFGDYVARQLGYRSGWKYWAIRGGVAIGGAVIGWFAGTAILKVMTKFLLANPAVMARMPGLVLWFLGIGGGGAAITNALQNIIPNTINHIMQSKHAWNLIGNNTWASVSRAIKYVLTKGSSTSYTAGNTIYTAVYTAVYNGKTVQVVTRLADGVLRIVDAWVKTK